MNSADKRLCCIVLLHVILPALAGVLFLLLFTPSALAEDRDENAYTIVVNEVRSLNIESNDGFAFPEVNQWRAGWTEVGEWNAIVSSNTGWVLTIKGGESTWDAPWAKPVGDIFWQFKGNGYRPLSTDAAVVCSGGPSDHQITPVQYRVALSFKTDIPGDYIYPYVIFELSPP